MRAWRSRRRFGAGLGLFALLLQLALSFAHIHPEDVFGIAASGIARAAADTAPATRDQDRHAPGTPHDDCPICAAMHLAGTIVVPEPPVLAVPTAFTVAAFSIENFLTTVVPRRLPFQTRAPPAA